MRVVCATNNMWNKSNNNFNTPNTKHQMCGPRGPATRFSHLPQSHKCWNQPCNVARLALTAITGFGYCAANAINIYKFTHSLLLGNCKIRNARCADKAHTQLALVLHVYAIYCALTFFHCSSIILFSLSLSFSAQAPRSTCTWSSSPHRQVRCSTLVSISMSAIGPVTSRRRASSMAFAIGCSAPTRWRIAAPVRAYFWVLLIGIRRIRRAVITLKGERAKLSGYISQGKWSWLRLPVYNGNSDVFLVKKLNKFTNSTYSSLSKRWSW